MNKGMLWFDNDPKVSLVDKVAKAAAYYLKKYGAVADTCLVHPSMLSSELPAGKISIRSNRSIQPGHLWIGVDEK